MLGLLARTNQVRLNIGAGDKVLDGYLSVGLSDAHDIKADVRSIPIPDASADEIILIHVLEHLWRWDVPAAMTEWLRILKPGGRIALELPDVVKCARNLIANPGKPRLGILGMFGDPAYGDPLMMHKWGWTEREVKECLAAAGFVKIKSALPQFHARRTNRDMRIEARKPN